ncbi:MAG: porin family protein [Rhodanobacter sp.]
MYNKRFILALAVGGLLATATVHADQPTGWFANTNLGTAHYKAHLDGVGSGTESDTAFMVNAGYRDERILGFEVGYTNLGSVAANDGAGSRAKLSADGWNLGANGHFKLSDRWFLSARGGAFQWKLRAKATLVDEDGAQTVRGNTQSLDWYAGVGTGYDIDAHWGVGANFDYYKMAKQGLDLGTRVFSVSAEYRF